MMSKFLVVSATAFEIKPLLDFFQIDTSGQTEGMFMSRHENGMDLQVLITGVGMVNTAYYMGRYSHHLFDYIINLGIAGSFNRNIRIGEVVNVKHDQLSEMGAEDGEQFIPYPELNLGGTNQYKANGEIIYQPLQDIKSVKSLTVNKVHGNEAAINVIKNMFQPDIESMEGAAFFRSCEKLSGASLQLRAISNYVEKRDKSKWNIPLAIENLNQFAIPMIEYLNQKK